MTAAPRFIVDSDVFITAKNTYYAFELCPGFWKGLILQHQRERIFSIDRVKNELLVGLETDDLVQWVKNELPATFFLTTGEEAIISAYTEIMGWVQRSAQYFDNAKAQFATGADGWLVAFAKVHDAIVVTNEQPQPAARNRAPDFF